MEGDSTNKLTEAKLRDAGASETYITYYLTAKDMGVSTHSTNHAEKVVNEGVSHSGGGFHDSLWDAKPRWSGENPYGADSQNQKILREAGVYGTPEMLA
jgi:hypothetical protein